MGEQKKPHANRHLKNVEAVTKMLNGKHFTQTRTQVGYTKKKDTKIREVGEKWIEADASGGVIEWEQKKGYRVKKRKNLQALFDLQDYLRTYSNCHKETCDAKGTRLDKKFKKISGRCADCHFAFERKLKDEDKFEEYAENFMIDRIKGFLRQAEQEKEAIITALEEVVFPNQDGSKDSFTVDNKQAIIDRINNDFEKLKENLLKGKDGKQIEYE